MEWPIRGRVKPNFSLARRCFINAQGLKFERAKQRSGDRKRTRERRNVVWRSRPDEDLLAFRAWLGFGIKPYERATLSTFTRG